MFDALYGGVELVADGLWTGTESEGDFCHREIFHSMHIKDFFHAFGQAIHGLQELLLGFLEVELFVSGVRLVIFGYLAEGIDMFLIEVFIAHRVEEAMFKGGAEVGKDGGNGGEGAVFFPEMYKYRLDRVLCSGRVAGDPAGVGEEVLPVELEELTESVFIT